MAPKIPAVITCSSGSMLDYELNIVADGLGLIESEDSWDKIALALTRFTALTNGCAADFPAALVAAAKMHARPIANSLNSERSRLSGASTDLLTALALNLTRPFEPLIPLFVPPLLALATRSNKIFIARARNCLQTIVEHVQSPALLPFLRMAVSDKSTSLRLVATDLVAACLNCYNPPDIENPHRAEDIETVVRSTACDASADVRKSSRKVFEAYKILLPARVDTFVGPLTPIARKYLDIRAKVKAAPTKPLILSASLPASATNQIAAAAPNTARTRPGHTKSSSASSQVAVDPGPSRAPSRASSRQGYTASSSVQNTAAVKAHPPAPLQRVPSSSSTGPVRPPPGFLSRENNTARAPSRPFSRQQAFDPSKSQPVRSGGGAQRPTPAPVPVLPAAPAHHIERSRSVEPGAVRAHDKSRFDITRSIRPQPQPQPQANDTAKTASGPRRVAKTVPVPISAPAPVPQEIERREEEKRPPSVAEGRRRKEKAALAGPSGQTTFANDATEKEKERESRKARERQVSRSDAKAVSDAKEKAKMETAGVKAPSKGASGEATEKDSAKEKDVKKERRRVRERERLDPGKPRSHEAPPKPDTTEAHARAPSSSSSALASSTSSRARAPSVSKEAASTQSFAPSRSKSKSKLASQAGPQPEPGIMSSSVEARLQDAPLEVVPIVVSNAPMPPSAFQEVDVDIEARPATPPLNLSELVKTSDNKPVKEAAVVADQPQPVVVAKSKSKSKPKSKSKSKSAEQPEPQPEPCAMSSSVEARRQNALLETDAAAAMNGQTCSPTPPSTCSEVDAGMEARPPTPPFSLPEPAKRNDNKFAEEVVVAANQFKAAAAAKPKSKSRSKSKSKPEPEPTPEPKTRGRHAVKPLVIHKLNSSTQSRGSVESHAGDLDPKRTPVPPDAECEHDIPASAYLSPRSPALTIPSSSRRSPDLDHAATVPLPITPPLPTPLRAGAHDLHFQSQMAATPISKLLVSIQRGFNMDFSMIGEEDEDEDEGEARYAEEARKKEAQLASEYDHDYDENADIADMDIAPHEGIPRPENGEKGEGEGDMSLFSEDDMAGIDFLNLMSRKAVPIAMTVHKASSSIVDERVPFAPRDRNCASIDAQ
ncbi:clasp N terminal-domain-containing protein [Phellopilus nigrolimitatus]|nr:clasp N terminal-domain-containing protein [Phellopilus nigrolimitatus]